jgi:oxazoline/thiazoline synthase
MIGKPQFQPHLVLRRDADGVTLLHEEGAIPLPGSLHEMLAPLIDGRRSVDDIIRRLAGRATAVDVAFGLDDLEERGLIFDAADGDAEERSVLAAALGMVTAAPPPARSAAAVITVGGVDAAPLESALRSSAVAIDPEAPLAIVVTDDYLRPELAEIHRAAAARSRPWMAVKPGGLRLWIGPLFDPPRTPCWHCLARRLREWRRALGQLSTLDGEAVALPAPATPATAAIAFGIAAAEAGRWLFDGETSLAGALLTFDVRTLRTARHVLSPAPGCPGCGAAAGQAVDGPPRLVARPKGIAGDHRAAPAGDTLERYAHLVSPITGIVDRVASYHRDPAGLFHLYEAGHFLPAPVEPDPALPSIAYRRSAGRGTTAEQARAGALCEALERYSGFFHGTERRREAVLNDLGDSAIHPHDCLLVSERQYADREAWNRRDYPYHWIPCPLDAARPVDWTAAWSLTAGAPRYLATAYCFYRYPLPADHRFCRADSNGCAAGSCLEEAILAGFYEIVERDALALWWYSRALRPGMAIDAAGQPFSAALVERFRSLGRDIWLLDVTTDLGIPAFVAVSRERCRRPGDVMLGAGAHLDPAVAMAHALTEASQFLPGVLAGRPKPVLSAHPEDDAFLEPDAAAPERHAGDSSHAVGGDLLADLELCVERARQRGLEVLLVDQTRAEVGLPVARVVVPGMRLFRARFAPGRLYDVPLAQGWVSAPLDEARLNDCHILI